MKWISATDLGRWGETIAARTDLPGLVGDLIRATAADITDFRFPSGDKGQVRGFDGHLESGGGSIFVPAGRSYWEFGASKSQAAKFGEDIKKRTDQVSDEDRQKTTFIFVTPQTWDNPSLKLEDALKPFQNDFGWKDVFYIDGAKLETWLDQAPGVAATHARLTVRTKPQIGARSCEEFWDSYSGRFKVDLTEEVLLCEREDQQQRLLEHLRRTGDVLTLAADSPDEVIAFAVATIRKAAPEDRLFLEARTLVVDSEEAAFELRASDKLIFLVRDKARPHAGMLSRAGPTVVGVGFDQKRGNEFLGNPSTHGMAKALATMEGISEEEGEVLARKAGRSVTILSRTIPRGAPDSPRWLASGRQLLPAMLAGGWEGRSENDCNVVAMLTADGDYGRLEETLRPLSRMQDAPVDLIGSVWQMRAPVDAFVHLGHLITQADLERLQAAVTEIFGTVIAEPDDDAPFPLPSDKVAGFSQWLRNGVATTLLQIAVLSDQADFRVAGIHPQGFVNDLIKALPGLASDARLLVSIRDQLPILMEAAPDPLLEALEHLLEGDAALSAPLLAEQQGFFSPSSPLTNILWALEMLAWDPAHLERVSLLLARLVELDPGGRLSNRPANSLQTIYTPWLPSTHARLEQRLAALEVIIDRHDKVGWDLVVALLPQHHGTTSLTSKPRYREAGASDVETLTRGIVRQTYDHLIDRAMDLAGVQPDRWVALTKHFQDFSPGRRETFYAKLEGVLASLTPAQRAPIWEATRDKAARHRSFASAAWALPDAELEHLEGIIKAFEPGEPLDKNRWLFDDWFPDMPGEFDEREARISAAREEAVRNMMDVGYQTILKAVQDVKLPQFLGVAAGRVLTLDVIERLVQDTLLGSEETRTFVVSLSSVARQMHGEAWEARVRAMCESTVAPPSDLVALFLAWPDTAQIWDFIKALSPEIDREYWLQKQPFRLQGEEADLQRALQAYLDVGRPSAALTVASNRFDSVDPGTLFTILDGLPDELGASSRPPDQLVAYMVEQALENLEARSDVELTELAKREYLYLDLLRFRKKTLGIHRLMAQDAGFYFSVISAVFRARSDDGDEEPSPEARARAKSGYTLLSEFHAVPGCDGKTVDYEVLRSWVDQVRKLAAENDRVGITDDFIGRILAHSPNDEDDGLWPHQSVRRVIEEVRSAPLEEGFAVEKYNSRGVYMKAIYEGGKQEREIGEYFRSQAKQITSPRTSAMLHRMADRYFAYADDEDLRAEQDKMRSS